MHYGLNCDILYLIVAFGPLRFVGYLSELSHTKRALPFYIERNQIFMSNYIIVTDSAADLNQELVDSLELQVYSLSFTMDGVTRHDRPDRAEMSTKDFYAALRSGSLASTAAVNANDYIEGLDPVLAAGTDVLILAFASSLSATHQAAVMAAEELSERYPERRIHVIDTYCATVGLGLLVWHAAKRRQAGSSMDEVIKWVEENKMSVCHWFTVDDLNFLKRGGRVSGATAVIGTMLSIKPLLHVADDGKLLKCATARGRAASVNTLIKNMEETLTDRTAMCIVHGDCEDEALQLKAELHKRFGEEMEIFVLAAGPVIGAHTGPGLLGTFFMGSKR